MTDQRREGPFTDEELAEVIAKQRFLTPMEHRFLATIERLCRDVRNAEGERDAALRLLAGEREGRICQTAELRKIIDSAEGESDALRADAASLKSQMSQFGEVVNEAWAFVTAPWGSGEHPAPKLRDAMARLASQPPTGEATAGLPAGYQYNICPECHR